MKKVYKLFVAIVIVAVSLLVIDVIIGKWLDYKFDNMPNNGGIGKTRYVIREMNSDIVVIGSSRAEFHYNSNIIAEEMGLSTYNAGQSGTDLNKHICYIDAITDRYTPQIIVLEVQPRDLYNYSDPSMKDLYVFYHDNDFIKRELQVSDGIASRIYGSVNMLRYNDLLITLMLAGRFSSNEVEQAERLHGYVPLPAVKHKIPLVKEQEDIPRNGVVNPRQLEMVEYIFNKLKKKGITLVVAISPTFYDYSEGKDKTYKIWDSICHKYNVRFVDDSDIPYFTSHPEWYKDDKHLNADGADEYTRFFIKSLKRSKS